MCLQIVPASRRDPQTGGIHILLRKNLLQHGQNIYQGAHSEPGEEREFNFSCTFKKRQFLERERERERFSLSADLTSKEVDALILFKLKKNTRYVYFLTIIKLNAKECLC